MRLIRKYTRPSRGATQGTIATLRRGSEHEWPSRAHLERSYLSSPTKPSEKTAWVTGASAWATLVAVMFVQIYQKVEYVATRFVSVLGPTLPSFRTQVRVKYTALVVARTPVSWTCCVSHATGACSSRCVTMSFAGFGVLITQSLCK